ncbi:hypothetical protein C2845_PM15G01250 [Panicum miliaceum]|uniref:Uncharacterized protein n=1 Tax=Panicum miliaceum TaxID=4540 RepID=A0A3L6Q6H6_PANMI|nr:hypothetical protein C2845_PM15G01250 [Panicum miliaceum]
MLTTAAMVMLVGWLRQRGEVDGHHVLAILVQAWRSSRLMSLLPSNINLIARKRDIAAIEQYKLQRCTPSSSSSTRVASLITTG